LLKSTVAYDLESFDH